MTCTHLHIGSTCVNICGDETTEASREPEQVRWCFGCRKHLMHFLVVRVPVGLSYYGPTVHIECEGCGRDRADFPGTYRDGPRYDFYDDASASGGDR